mmetsp:Transcript_132994/g.384623  ORF Transcript_132994/g.384623 Transcript_132994/m.384623 type:complete len:318 (+) Transcript_132994:409-1362(+)
MRARRRRSSSGMWPRSARCWSGCCRPGPRPWRSRWKTRRPRSRALSRSRHRWTRPRPRSPCRTRTMPGCSPPLPNPSWAASAGAARSCTAAPPANGRKSRWNASGAKSCRDSFPCTTLSLASTMPCRATKRSRRRNSTSHWRHSALLRKIPRTSSLRWTAGAMAALRSQSFSMHSWTSPQVPCCGSFGAGSCELISGLMISRRPWSMSSGRSMAGSLAQRRSSGGARGGPALVAIAVQTSVCARAACKRPPRARSRTPSRCRARSQAKRVLRRARRRDRGQLPLCVASRRPLGWRAPMASSRAADRSRGTTSREGIG